MAGVRSQACWERRENTRPGALPRSDTTLKHPINICSRLCFCHRRGLSVYKVGLMRSTGSNATLLLLQKTTQDISLLSSLQKPFNSPFFFHHPSHHPRHSRSHTKLRGTIIIRLNNCILCEILPSLVTIHVTTVNSGTMRPRNSAKKR